MKVLHEPPQDFIDAHVAICHRKTRRKHYGLGARKRRCARELYSRCIELGVEPTISNDELGKRIAELEGKEQ